MTDERYEYDKPRHFDTSDLDYAGGVHRRHNIGKPQATQDIHKTPKGLRYVLRKQGKYNYLQLVD